MDLRERSANQGERHPWEVARKNFVAQLITDHALLPAGSSALDVGAGDAWLASEIAAGHPRCHFVCVDAFYTPHDIAHITADNLHAQATVPDQRFALITALDVIEHVDDDRGFLGGLVENNLADGGSVLITVPAWQLLWTTHDDALEHRRRYSPKTLAALIADCELESVSSGGFFHSLLPVRGLAAARERILGAEPTDEAAVSSWSAPRLLTRAITAALAVDNAITRAFARASIALPGLSLWALCRAPS